jgi:hypothetical protein
MPPAAAPAPVAAPAAAPAPKPSPAPAPAPKPKTPEPGDEPPIGQRNSDTPVKVGHDFDAELEALANETPEPEKPKRGRPKAKEGVQPPEEKGGTEEGEAEPVAEGQPPPEAEPKGIAEVRTAYQKAKTEIEKTYKPQVAKLEARIKELETAKPDEASPILLKRAEEAEKRLAQAEDALRFVDFSKSSEYQEKYHKPYLEAWQRACGDFAQLKVKIADGVDDDTGQARFKSRPATDDDLIYLANLPLSEMDEKAQEMFGSSAARVIHHVEKVRELYSAQQKALNEAKMNGGERAKQTDAQRKASQEQAQKLWGDRNKALAEKFPNWYAEIPGDTEGNELFKKGLAMVDRILQPSEQNPAPKTIEERVALDSTIRMKVANHDRLALRLKKVRAELAEAKKALAEFEGSEPPAGRAGAGGAGGGARDYVADAEAELDKMAR